MRVLTANHVKHLQFHVATVTSAFEKCVPCATVSGVTFLGFVCMSQPRRFWSNAHMLCVFKSKIETCYVDAVIPRASSQQRAFHVLDWLSCFPNPGNRASVLSEADAQCMCICTDLYQICNPTQSRKHSICAGRPIYTILTKPQICAYGPCPMIDTAHGSRLQKH